MKGIQMKKIVIAAGVGVVLAGMCAPTASAAGSAVKPTQASVTAWTKSAAQSSMVTREVGEGDSRTTCNIAVNQASDCISRIPGNPATQTVTNADASRQWFRTLPKGKWKSDTTAAHVNPVADTSRFFSYDPFTPWTAKADLGVTWSMKRANGNVVIESHIKKFGDGELPDTTVTISQNGKRFTIASGTNEGVVMSTTGVLKPVTVKIPG